MDIIKQQHVFNQYINQYIPTVDNTLATLRHNKDRLHIPYAQFVFSLIDYFGLLYSVTTGSFNKRDTGNNFRNFLKSPHYPQDIRCKASLVYFTRNGVMHQIFPKACGLNAVASNDLFYNDPIHNIPVLNIFRLDELTRSAIDNFIADLQVNSIAVDNIHNLLITNNYGFNDHVEFQGEIDTNFGGVISNIYNPCI